MPEYLAPGVYVEEVSYRAKSIEGVSTTTTGFIGATRYGPFNLVPDVITSLVEFERVYGDRQQLNFGQGPVHNYMWHAVRQFFENGGKRLYIARTFRTPDTAKSPSLSSSIPPLHAYRKPVNAGDKMLVWARFPGAAGNMRIRITLTAGANGYDPATKKLRGVVNRDVVMMKPVSSPVGSGTPEFLLTESFFDGTGTKWRLRKDSSTTRDLDETIESVQVVTATVTIFPVDPNIASFVYPELALDPNHRRNGADDSMATQFAEEQPSLGRARTVPIVTDLSAFDDGLELINHLLSIAPVPAWSSPLTPDLEGQLADPASSVAERSFDFMLEDGGDGELPEVGEYEGVGGDPTDKTKSGLMALEDIDEISIIAAPGCTANYASRGNQVNAIVSAVISHAQRMRYRIAVIDAGDKQSIADVRDMRGKIDSTYAAFYYPWLTIFDPVTQKEITTPPSGAVAGIYARNDINRGVYKAPANEVVDGVISLENILNKSQQDILNPLGINCFRFFEGRGYRLWGARTATSDPEWKYVNLRRYFAYLEHSLDKGTQWAVFEPNGERLWANVRIAITDFLFNEWVNGALLGDKAEKAFFVKCDRSTMTQNDLDNGRMVCLVGVAALRPAEYVIIRIGQWTADRKV
jgi:hypothetical protein